MVLICAENGSHQTSKTSHVIDISKPKIQWKAQEDLEGGYKKYNEFEKSK